MATYESAYSLKSSKETLNELICYCIDYSIDKNINNDGLIKLLVTLKYNLEKIAAKCSIRQFICHLSHTIKHNKIGSAAVLNALDTAQRRINLLDDTGGYPLQLLLAKVACDVTKRSEEKAIKVFNAAKLRVIETKHDTAVLEEKLTKLRSKIPYEEYKRQYQLCQGRLNELKMLLKGKNELDNSQDDEDTRNYIYAELLKSDDEFDEFDEFDEHDFKSSL
jgi:hypothetical protein